MVKVLLMDNGSFKRLIWPTLSLLVIGSFIATPWFREAREELQKTSAEVLEHVGWLTLGLSVSWFIVRMLDVLVWTTLEKRTGNPIPRLFRDIVAFIVFLVIGLIILGTVLEHDVNKIWAATGLVGIVVGFALRGMIADIFSGIALNLDQPFKIGEWVQIHPRSVDPMYGEVIEISWRSTRIRRTNNTVLSIPNSLMSSIVLVNFSQPTTANRFGQSYILEFGVSSDRAIRVLLAGVKSAKGVLKEPAPQVLVNGITQWGVEYKVRYWLEVTEVTPRRGRHEVNKKILEQLYQSGLTLAYPKEDLYIARMPNRQLDHVTDRTAILSRVEIFSKLKSEELEDLADRMRKQKFKEGELIVRMGDNTDSMFILVEGFLTVHKSAEEFGDRTKVGEIEAGSFFGEMSLFTGEERSASILAATEAMVFEIRKEDVTPLLENRPEIAVQISQIMAERRAALMAHVDQEPEMHQELKETFAQQLLDKMKRIFAGLRNTLNFFS